MKQLVCEMCGSTELIKQDGVFVCQTCGCKYSVEEAKKMIVEGTVEVRGTVKVDRSSELENYVKKAISLLDSCNKESAKECCDRIRDIDFNSIDAEILDLFIHYGRFFRSKICLDRVVVYLICIDKLETIKQKATKTMKEIIIPVAESLSFIELREGEELPKNKIIIKTNNKIGYFNNYGECCFKGIKTLTSVVITEGVKSINNFAFSDCSLLTSVTIGNSVTSIGSSAFDGCSSLTKVNYTGTIDQWAQITFESFDSNPLCYAKNLYIGDKVVTEAELTTATKVSSYAFYSCASLTSITIPAGVGKIELSAFSECQSLERIECKNPKIEINSIGRLDLKNVKSIKGSVEFVNAFICEKTESIEITGGDKFKLRINKAKNLTDIKMGELYSGSTLYEGDILLFESKNIVIPEEVTYIAPGAFAGTDIESVVIPSSVNAIGEGAFQFCNELKSVIINGPIETIKKKTFYCCGSLEKVDLPMTLKQIEKEAFFYCTKLYLRIPKYTVIPTKFINNEYIYEDNILGYERIKGNIQQGCYVATCVYGSYDCPQVWTLRRYRDNTLGSTWYGRAFIRLYYAVSPTLVKWFGETKWFKKMWKGKLDRMVNKLQSKGVENTPYNDKNWTK